MNDDGQMVDKNQKYLVSMGDYSKTCMHYHVKSDHVLTKLALGLKVMKANWKIARKSACLFHKEIYCPQCRYRSVNNQSDKGSACKSTRIKKRKGTHGLQDTIAMQISFR